MPKVKVAKQVDDPLRGLEMSIPIGPDAPMAASYAGVAPFAAQITPAVVHADQCLLDTSSTSLLQGTRALVVDVTVPRAQTIHLALSSSSAAVLEAGDVEAALVCEEEATAPIQAAGLGPAGLEAARALRPQRRRDRRSRNRQNNFDEGTKSRLRECRKKSIGRISAN